MIVRIPKRVFFWTLSILAIVFTCGWLFFPRYAQHTVDTAQKQFRMGDAVAAERTLASLLWIQPSHGQANLLKGQIRQAQQDHDSAALYLSRIPANAQCYQRGRLLLAFAHLRRMDLAAAEIVLSEHVNQFPDEDAAADELYWLYYNQLRLREAAALLDKRLVESPNSHKLLLAIANTRIRDPIPRESLPYLIDVNKSRPGQPDVLAALLYCHWQLGDNKAALEMFSQLRHCTPIGPRHRFIAAEFCMENHDIELAREFLKQPCPAYDIHIDVWYWLNARLALFDNNPSGASKFIRLALDKQPTIARYWQFAATLARLQRQNDVSTLSQQAERIEKTRQQLYEMLEKGELQRPTRQNCVEAAKLWNALGEPRIAQGWEQMRK